MIFFICKSKYKFAIQNNKLRFFFHMCIERTSLLFKAICKASPDSHFAFLHFFSMGMVLIPVSCTMSRTSFHSYELIVVLFRDMKPRNRNSLQHAAKESSHTENTMKPLKLRENTFVRGQHLSRAALQSLAQGGCPVSSLRAATP